VTGSIWLFVAVMMAFYPQKTAREVPDDIPPLGVSTGAVAPSITIQKTEETVEHADGRKTKKITTTITNPDGSKQVTETLEQADDEV